ncbi:MAG TPA: glycosyltransferase, partial [Candidatus Dojkabacteria bacterium]|nr:glycosyltransferase [Candidatus Dojkabacteria bacterium]
SYLGSIGTWYMLKEMILFFKQLKQRYSEAKFLILTHSNTDLLIHEIEKSALNKDDFIIRSATRQEVPALIKASDINLSFIKPAYSKISSSPTKLGEVLSTGIPVICNSGVGDVEVIINQTKGGYLIHDFTEMDFKLAIEAIPGLLNLSPSSIRERSADFYDLKVGVQKYYEAYQKVLG